MVSYLFAIITALVNSLRVSMIDVSLRKLFYRWRDVFDLEQLKYTE